MIGKIKLDRISEYEPYTYDFSFDIGNINYCVSINIDLDQDFLTLISTPGDMIEAIDNYIEYLQSNQNKESIILIEELKKVKENPIKYINEAEYVQFNFENDETLEYLKRNPILKEKKLLLKPNFDFDSRLIEEIKDKFKDYLDNLYFKLPGNSNYISFNEYEATLKSLDTMVEEIKQYNFSPLEQIMYAYDITKNRVYQKEGKDEDESISRDLSSSLLGDKIVCLGYARIFNTLLYKLGIKSNEVILISEPTGHARNEIYIKDEKYGIDGVYYFDPTWDSKRKDNETEHLFTYRFFARTRREMERMERMERKEYTNKLFPYYYTTMDSDFEKQYSNGGIKNVDKNLVRSLNYMSRLIRHESLLKPLQLVPDAPLHKHINLEKTVAEATKLIEYFKKPIYADTLIKVLYNIKKQQYYKHPDKYPFEIDSFYKTVFSSNWSFEPSAEQKLLSCIFGEEANTKPTPQRFKNFNDEHQLDKNIEQIKLSKTLRKILENKQKK